MIQKTYRGLLGRRRANWQRVIRRLKKEDDQTLSWLRQKYVADAVQDAELAALVPASHENQKPIASCPLFGHTRCCTLCTLCVERDQGQLSRLACIWQAKYTKLEQAMSAARSDIVDREQRAERQFKMEARKAQERIRKVKGWGAWLPQAGTVSGKKYFYHTETGEVRWGRHTMFLHARAPADPRHSRKMQRPSFTTSDIADTVCSWHSRANHCFEL
jgi:hypothetical protein